MTDTGLQVGEKTETHHMNLLGKTEKTVGRAVESTLQKDLGRTH